MDVPPDRFPLAGARLVLDPSPDGGYTARLDAAPLPAEARLARDMTVCPSPARADSRAVFRTEITGTYEIELIDAAGRRVARRNLGHLDPGLHAVVLAELAADRPAAGGTYFVRLIGSADMRIAKVIYLP